MLFSEQFVFRMLHLLLKPTKDLFLFVMRYNRVLCEWINECMCSVKCFECPAYKEGCCIKTVFLQFTISKPERQLQLTKMEHSVQRNNKETSAEPQREAFPQPAIGEQLNASYSPPEKPSIQMDYQFFDKT